MSEGLRTVNGNPAAPPYTGDAYKWDANVTFAQGVNGVIKGTKGKCYYVDEENGADGNDGLTPQTAFASILAATALSRDDYSADAEYHIFIAPGSYDESDDLRLYGYGIHLHGLGNPGSDSGVNITDTNVTQGILLLAGANCTIENIQFTSATALPPLYAIASDNTVITNCVFKGTSGTSVNAIQGEDVRGTEISYCTFGVSNGDYTNNLYMTGGADQYCIDSYFHHNRISSNNTSATGILIDNTCVAYGNVFDNNFINLTGTTPKGIDINSTGVNLITNNYVVITSAATPIESASSPTGIVGNHTMAGSTTVDPNEAAD